jgi:hypothetical protein
MGLYLREGAYQQILQYLCTVQYCTILVPFCCKRVTALHVDAIINEVTLIHWQWATPCHSSTVHGPCVRVLKTRVSMEDPQVEQHCSHIHLKNVAGRQQCSIITTSQERAAVFGVGQGAATTFQACDAVCTSTRIEYFLQFNDKWK